MPLHLLKWDGDATIKFKKKREMPPPSYLYTAISSYIISFYAINLSFCHSYVSCPAVNAEEERPDFSLKSHNPTLKGGEQLSLNAFQTWRR